MKSRGAWWRKIRGAAAVVRLTPFDDSTDEGRSRERYRRVVLTAGGTMLAKAVTALTVLVSVPLTVNYLGAERYGMWMTISSLITVLSFADLGIGNGLVNALAAARGRQDHELAARYVSSAFFILAGVGVAIGGLFLLLGGLVDWARLFNVHSRQAIEELPPALTIFVVCLALNIPLGLVEKVQTGYQEGFLNSIWQGAGNLLALAGVLLAVWLEAGLPWLVLAMAGTPVLTTALNWLIQFQVRRPELRPTWRSFDRATSRQLTNLGAFFLVIQFLAILGTASDNIIIARYHGAAAVAGYAVVQKLFSIALIPHYLVAPLWPAFGEALARRDHAWAERALRRAVVLSVLFEVVVALPLVLGGRNIISSWLDTSLAPSRWLLLGFGMEAILGAYRTTMGVFLNSSSLLRRQSLIFGLAAVVALILKLLLGRYFYLSGVIWATVIAFGVLYAGPAWVLARQLLRGLADEAGDGRSIVN